MRRHSNIESSVKIPNLKKKTCFSCFTCFILEDKMGTYFDKTSLDENDPKSTRRDVENRAVWIN